MRTKTRQIPSRDSTRRAILDAARALFVREGYEGVSIRRIAERIDISAAAIYLHFPGKADILAALTEEGFRRLAGVLARPEGTTRDPLAALEEHFWRYYEFSKRQPQFYWLMFVDRSGRRIARDPEGAGWMRAEHALVGALIGEGIHAGFAPPARQAAKAFDLLFAAVHGAAVLRMGGRFCTHAAADVLARDVLHAALSALRAGGAEPKASPAPQPVGLDADSRALPPAVSPRARARDGS